MIRSQDGDQQEAQDEFGEFLPEEGGFVLYGFGLSLAGPVDGVGQDYEANHGVAGGLGQDGEFACGVGVEGTSGGGFGGVVYGQAGPEAVGVVAEMEPMADQRKGEEREGA